MRSSKAKAVEYARVIGGRSVTDGGPLENYFLASLLNLAQ